MVQRTKDSTGNEQGFIILGDPVEHQSASVLFGFDDDAEALEFLLAYAQALGKTLGFTINVINPKEMN